MVILVSDIWLRKEGIFYLITLSTFYLWLSWHQTHEQIGSLLPPFHGLFFFINSKDLLYALSHSIIHTTTFGIPFRALAGMGKSPNDIFVDSAIEAPQASTIDSYIPPPGNIRTLLKNENKIIR